MATITKLPSGKYRVQVRKEGQYKSSTFIKKGDAKSWGAEIERQISQLTSKGYVEPKGLTLGYLIKTYMSEVTITGRTKLAVLIRLQKQLGHLKLDQIDLNLQAFINTRLKDGAGGATIAGDLSFLSAVLDWAKEVKRFKTCGSIARTARGSLKHKKLTTRSVERERIPKKSELDELFVSWDNNKRLNTPMTEIVKFAASSAMRLSEICSIRIEDVNFEDRSVIIRDRKDPQKKIGNNQIVPLLGEAWTIVERRCEDQTSGRIFKYEAKSVSSNFTRTCQKLNIIDLHFHDMRHYAITNLFNAGLTIPQVSVISGHKSWNNLKRYTNLNALDIHRAYGEVS